MIEFFLGALSFFVVLIVGFFVGRKSNKIASSDTKNKEATEVVKEITKNHKEDFKNDAKEIYINSDTDTDNPFRDLEEL